MITLTEFGRSLAHFPESCEAEVRAWAARYSLNLEAAVGMWRAERQRVADYLASLESIAVLGYN